MLNITFKIDTKEAGQRNPYGDSFYHYLITTMQEEHVVKAYCTKVLRPSYPKDKMPNAFSGELLSFKKITQNNKSFLDSNEETYEYKTRSEFTG